jgi:hypothetical protein
MRALKASVNWVLRVFQLRICAVFELSFRFHTENLPNPGAALPQRNRTFFSVLLVRLDVLGLRRRVAHRRSRCCRGGGVLA